MGWASLYLCDVYGRSITPVQVVPLFYAHRGLTVGPLFYSHRGLTPTDRSLTGIGRKVYFTNNSNNSMFQSVLSVQITKHIYSTFISCTSAALKLLFGT